MSPDHPLLVVSDTHLGVEAPPQLSHDLAGLVSRHPGSEIVLAGDVFDLSFARAKESSVELLLEVLDRAPEVVRALRRHVAKGDPITVIPGNHDAALGETAARDVLRSRLDVQSDAPVNVSSWFVRRRRALGDVHIEHGHVYDPDNAPIHPLAEWDDRTEPLGIALTRRFVAPVGAGSFAHAQDATPVDAIARAFRVYGPRAPSMIASYFKIAIALCLEGGRTIAPLAERERAVGAARVDAFAAAIGVPEARLLAMLAGVPRPTHLRKRDLFFRLYFDRVFAGLLLAGASLALPRPSAALVSAASFAYLAGSVLRGKDRYGGLPSLRLSEGAGRVRELTDARLVVFGHSHEETVQDGYVNTGAFGFPKRLGRPYVLVDRNGEAELRRFA